ncbi:MAG: sensor signal transduction histidine kinase [Bacteroidetes bacterium]|nr:sensor signal transduction histidine kinase [Bacteroidota bacterium]
MDIQLAAKHPDNNILFLAGGGEMGKLTREKDWSKTSLGHPQSWPQSLRTTLSIILNSRFPMFLFWGEDHICFYNDAYRPSLGKEGKHPAILGMKGAEAWTEIWPVIKPLMDQVLSGGESIWSEDQLIPIYRNGKIEDVYWTFSYSPVNDETGSPAGVFVTCTETTDKVFTLRELEESKSELEVAIMVTTDELERQVNERTKELVLTNESLRKSEERYHLMVEEVQDYAILYLNREGIVENWNTGAEKIKGYKAKEIIGKSFSNFYTEEDKKSNLPRKLLAQAAEKGRAVQEGWRVRKDGSHFWASVVITAVHNEKNEVIGFSKVTHDLTEKKEYEDKLKKTASELEQKYIDLEKVNAELQSFAYISSHDLQEPLRKIQTLTSILLERETANLTASGQDLFRRIQVSALRMQTLINDLLAYSRTSTADREYKYVDLNKILEEVKTDLIEELQQKHATLEASGLCEVSIIPFQFRQLLHNLFSNSLKFSDPERPLHIEVKGEVAKGSTFDNDQLSRNTFYCHIRIADNGIGFEQQYEGKIFDLFQRLHEKDKYGGTGIGLAIVKKIVDNHDGVITASGVLGKGATFDIYFPMR